MDDIANQLLPFLPTQYRAKALALLAISPYLTRAFYALQKGGGLRGILSSIWLGTNMPKAVERDIQNTKAQAQDNAERVSAVETKTTIP